MSSPTVTATKSSHVGRDCKQSTRPKVMFTGVVADNAEKVILDIIVLLGTDIGGTVADSAAITFTAA